MARWPQRYPGDPSVAVTLLLNLVQLEPGEAIQLGPGNLHAYLGGAGIELMGASDNVVRGGLTAKPVDVDDLLAVIDPTPLADPVLPPPRELSARRHVDPPAAPRSARPSARAETPRARRHSTAGTHRLPRARRRASTSPPATTAYVATA